MVLKCMRCGREIEIDPEDSRISMRCEACEQKACIERTQKRMAKPVIKHLSLGDHLPRLRAVSARGRRRRDFEDWF